MSFQKGEGITLTSAGEIPTPESSFLAADEPQFGTVGGAPPGVGASNGLQPVPGTGTTNAGLYPEAANGVEGAEGAGPFAPASVQKQNAPTDTNLTAKAAGGPSNIPPGLGSLAAREESSGDPGAIGDDFQETDGYAYGRYQMITKGKNGGTFGDYYRYLERNNPDIHAELESAGGLDAAVAGTPEFHNKFSTLMRTNPAAAQTQSDYIAFTHYEPQRRRVLTATGLDVGTRSKTLQDVLHSTSVQQGNQADRVFARAINRTGKTADTVSDRELIAAIYDERNAPATGSTVPGTRYFPTTVANGKYAGRIDARFARERTAALAQYDAEVASG